MWKTTNYHDHCISENSIKFENGCWYEIGFKTKFDSNFIHQGIKKFQNGFMDDENDYYLKPFPTHAKKIDLSSPNIV